MTLAEKLAQITQATQAELLQKKAEKGVLQAESKRIAQEKARLAEDREKARDELADLMLARSLKGIRRHPLKIDDQVLADVLDSNRFRRSITEERMRRISNVLRVSLPKVTSDLKRVLAVDELYLNEWVTHILENVDSFHGVSLNIVYDKLQEILNSIARDIKSREDMCSAAEAVIVRLDRSKNALLDKFPVVLSDYQVCITDRINSNPWRISRDRNLSRITKEQNLRNILQKYVPDVGWYASALPLVELRIVFEAASGNLSIVNAARLVVEKFELDASDRQKIEVIQLLGKATADLAAIRSLFNQFLIYFEKFSVLLGRMRSLAESENITSYSAFGLRCCRIIEYELSHLDERFVLFDDLLSQKGRRRLDQMVEILNNRALRGEKDASFSCLVRDSCFSLRSGRSFSISFRGTFNHFLSAINHVEGFGLGYEVYPRGNSGATLRLYWH
jgi:hypothetical protein